MKNENKNNFADPITDMEQDPGHAPDAKKKIKGLYSQCHLHVHSKRRRLADPDGISCKAAIDGLVHAGLLADDSPKQVSGVTNSQEKTTGNEETIITLTWPECAEERCFWWSSSKQICESQDGCNFTERNLK